MTTSTRRPTPGGLAAVELTPARDQVKQPYEPRSLTPAEAASPGQLQAGEHLRSFMVRALRKSRMHPEARLVALTLLGYANYKTGLVNSRHQPDTTTLAEDTGLTTGQVQVQLHVLTQRGWLYTRPLTRGPRNGQLGLFLAVPALYLEQVRADRAEYAVERAEYIARATGGTE